MKTQETIEEKVNIALGEASSLFMSQECKGTEIVMPSEELLRIGSSLSNEISLALQKQRDEIVEIVSDWFSKAPKYRTKENLIKVIKDINI